MARERTSLQAADVAWTIEPQGDKPRATMPSATARWTPQLKAEVVAAVRGGLLTQGEALAKYGLSPEEFAGWQRAIERFGVRGLRATHVQIYRAIEANSQAGQ